MGLKKRDFTGKMRTEIMGALKGDALTRRQILEALRSRKSLKPSVRRVGVALTRLLRSGKVIQVGTRASARFRSARP